MGGGGDLDVSIYEGHFISLGKVLDPRVDSSLSRIPDPSTIPFYEPFYPESFWLLEQAISQSYWRTVSNFHDTVSNRVVKMRL